MRPPRVLLLLCAGVLGPGVVPVFAQAPAFEDTRTLSTAIVPIERSFDIVQAGTYQLTLTDLAQPAALANVRVAVTRGSTVLASRTTAGVLQFDAPVAGPHVIRIVGLPAANATSGLVGVSVLRSGATTPFLEFVEPLSLLPAAVPPNRALVDATFTIPSAGNYTVALRDLALPQSLDVLTLVVTAAGGATLLARLDAAGSATFAASPGEHRVFAIGEAAVATAAGLYGIVIQADSNGQIVFEQSQPVGQVVELGAAALLPESHTLTLTDFSFPAALVARGAAVVRRGVAAARLVAAGQANFVPTAGDYEVFAFGIPAPVPGSGSYGVELRRTAGAAVLSAVRSVNGSEPGATPAFLYPVDIATGGNYRARMADFQLPNALSNLRLAIAQGAAVLATRDGAGPLDVTAAAGQLFLVVIAQPAQTSGLFGIEFGAAAGGVPLFETTQGVGGVFQSQRVTLTDTARYDLTLSDLEFPQRFAELAATVTRGAERLGLIIGSGRFDFPATPGDYFVSFLATPAASEQAGTYGIRVARVPPAPTVTLGVSPAAVASGATGTLTWSSTNATSCTASGAWTGSRAVSGSEPSPPVTASASFTLTCSGPGGTATQTVTLGITAPQSSGGGGALGTLVALVLASACLARARRRFATSVIGQSL